MVIVVGMWSHIFALLLREGACSGKTNQFHQNRLIEKSFQKGRIGGLGLMRVNWIIAQLHQRQWNQKEFQHVSDTDDASKHGHDFGFLLWWWFDDCYLWDLVQVCVEIFLNFAWRLQLLCFYVYIMSSCVFIHIHTSQFSSSTWVWRRLCQLASCSRLEGAAGSAESTFVVNSSQLGSCWFVNERKKTNRERGMQYELTSCHHHPHTKNNQLRPPSVECCQGGREGRGWSRAGGWAGRSKQRAAGWKPAGCSTIFDLT